MDELILRVLSGSATPSQEERVRGWRAESPENEAYFRITDRLWRATAPTVLVDGAVPVDQGVIVAAAAERRTGAAGSRRRWHRGVLPWGLAAAAAVAAIVVGIRVAPPDRAAQPLATYVADEGSARSVGLSDGSFVRLAPGSSLDVWDDHDQRRVTLTGRAFFAVARDESRPFVVGTGASEIRVLGTRFEVSDQERGVRTVVVEGRVAVSNQHGSVEVTSGSLALVAPDGPPSVEAAADVYALLDWPGGILPFQGTPLSQVAVEVGRFFQRSVEVRGADLPALRISGSFDGAGFEEVVLALCDAAGARCSLTEEGARIEPRP